MQGVRWNRAEEYYEGMCDACSRYWPLERDFWPVDGRGLRICRACDRLRVNGRVTLMRRGSATQREKDRGYAAAYYASLSPAERRALRRTEPRVVDDQRRWAREANARRKADGKATGGGGVAG